MSSYLFIIVGTGKIGQQRKIDNLNWSTDLMLLVAGKQD